MAVGLGMAGKAAADFDTKVRRVATQTGHVGASFEKIDKNARAIMPKILSQMSKFPAVADDMADAAYHIFSSTDLGVRDVSAGMKLLGLFNKTAVAGQADLTDVTEGGVRVGFLVIKSNATHLCSLMPLPRSDTL